MPLHKDLGDLHMKYDVAKQEINFFQSKLKDNGLRNRPRACRAFGDML